MESTTFGVLLKQLLKKNGISVIEFAAAIGTSRENVYTIFRRNSFDSELLWKMSVVLKQNLFKYFAENLDKEHDNNLHPHIALEDINQHKTSMPIELLQNENISLKRENELLRELNSLLKMQVNR